MVQNSSEMLGVKLAWVLWGWGAVWDTRGGEEQTEMYSVSKRTVSAFPWKQNHVLAY